MTKKVQALERDRDSGNRSKADRRGQTVEQWLTTWLETIAPDRVSGHTVYSTYRPKVRRIIDGVGAHRLRSLEPEHIEAFYARLRKEGLAQNTVLQHHRILSRALKVAVRRKLIAENPAALIDAPRAEHVEIEPLDPLAAQRVLRVCEDRRNGARWSVALALGVRQGEALGLRWSKLYAVCATCEYTAPMLRTSDGTPCGLCGNTRWEFEAETGWQIQRRPYEHGCADVGACTKGRHRRPCPKGCAGHHRPTCPSDCQAKSHRCPEVKRPCRNDCREHARECPERISGTWEFVRRKGAKEDAPPPRVALPAPLVAQLRAQHTAQAAERLQAGGMWEDWDLVFARPDGVPLNKKTDYEDWHLVLRAAGVPQARVHDARHTAATLLLAQGVDIRTVQQILGHSTLAMTQRYTHVTRRMGRAAADRMGAALWQSSGR